MKHLLISRDRLREIAQSLITYLKHPIREIAHVPEWEWHELIFVQVVVTALTGAATGLVAKSFLGVLSGLFITPILTMVTVAISSLFFYYFFQIFTERTLPFRRLATVVFLSNLPFFIFQILSSLVSFISLVGFAFTAIILIVGLVENFQIPRRMAVRVIACLYVAILAIWAWGRWESTQIETSWHSEKMDAPEVHLDQ